MPQKKVWAQKRENTAALGCHRAIFVENFLAETPLQ
jgi:hypothetical protein